MPLMACENFGATLAMCPIPETNKKMEDLIIKVSGPKYVRFMSAQIGYSAQDACDNEGANALSAMLMASASDKT